MGFCACTSKFILFFFNLICALLGIAVLAIGTYSYIQTRSLSGAGVHVNAIILIVFGALVFLVAFFGCWGAISENRCLLNTYAVIMTILLLALIAVGSVALATKGKLEKGLSTYIEETFSKAADDDKSDSMSLVENIQQSAKCCGVDGKNYWAVHNNAVPPSCCGKQPGSGQLCDLNQTYKDGCEKKVIDVFRQAVKLMGIFAIVVGCVELLGVVFAFVLAHNIRRKELQHYT